MCSTLQTSKPLTSYLTYLLHPPRGHFFFYTLPGLCVTRFDIHYVHKEINIPAHTSICHVTSSDSFTVTNTSQLGKKKNCNHKQQLGQTSVQNCNLISILNETVRSQTFFYIRTQSLVDPVEVHQTSRKHLIKRG